MEILTATTVFALLITKIVDFVRNAFAGGEGSQPPKWLWNLLALVLGVVVALVFDLNIFAEITDSSGPAWAGQVVTGLGMGATGSGWHEVLDALSGTAKSARAEADLKREALRIERDSTR